MLYDAFNDPVLLNKSNRLDSFRASRDDGIQTDLHTKHIRRHPLRQDFEEKRCTTPPSQFDQGLYLPLATSDDWLKTSRPSSPSAQSSSEAGENNESLQSNSQEFVTPIRSHGVPLDTITERTSIATRSISAATNTSRLSPSTPSSILIVPRERENSHSYPGCKPQNQLDRKHLKLERTTKSVDEKLLDWYRISVALSAIAESASDITSDEANGCEIPEIFSDLSGLDKALPEQSLEQSRSSTPQPGGYVKRPTSSYVRNIYHKLIKRDGSDDQADKAVSPSKIPIPSRLVSSRKTKYVTSEAQHRGNVQEDENHSASNDIHGEDAGTTSGSNTIEPFVPTQEHLSCRPIVGSHVVKHEESTPLIRSLNSPSSVVSEGNSASHCLPNISALSLPSLCEFLSSKLASEHLADIIASHRGNVGSPPHIAAQNRSIFDIGANERSLGDSRLKVPSRYATPNVRLSCRSFSGSPTHTTRCTSIQSSIELALNGFPQPPSPNIFVTPPPYQTSEANPESSCGLNVKKDSDRRTFYSLSDAEAPLNGQIAQDENHRQSSDAISLNLGGSEFREDEPLALRVQSDDDEGARRSRSISPNKTILMPSPLRPRSRPTNKYVLFPENPTVAGFPVIHALRSLSSMVRPASLTRRASGCSEGLRAAVRKGSESVHGPKVKPSSSIGRKSLLRVQGKYRIHIKRNPSERSKPGIFRRIWNRLRTRRSHEELGAQSINPTDGAASDQRRPCGVATGTNDACASKQPSNHIDAQASGNPSTHDQRSPTAGKFRRHNSSRPHRVPRIVKACFCRATDRGSVADDLKSDDGAARRIPSLNNATARTILE